MSNLPLHIPEEPQPVDPMALAQANQLIAQANAGDSVEEGGTTLLPQPNYSALHVDLPVGLFHPVLNKTVEEAEVRELTGEDEEYFLRGKNLRERKSRIIERGTVSLGEEEPDPSVLMALATADRETIILGICRATYGDDLELEVSCPSCRASQTPVIDLAEDVEVRKAEGITQVFTSSSGSKVQFRWQTGDDEKALGTWIEKNRKSSRGEMNTMFLSQVIDDIDGEPFFGESSARALGLKIRSEIVGHISENFPGPQWSDIPYECSECGHKASLEVAFEDLFR